MEPVYTTAEIRKIFSLAAAETAEYEENADRTFRRAMQHVYLEAYFGIKETAQ